MQLIQTLERGGYDVRLIQRDGIEIVEAQRKPEAAISIKAAAPFLLSLMRQQDEAIAAMRQRQNGELYRAIAIGGLSERDEAIAIYQFALLHGITVGSDDARLEECIRQLEMADE